MAVLTCDLCGEPAHTPISVNEKTFCCHGCKELFFLLGEEEITRLQKQEGLNWRAARSKTGKSSKTAPKTSAKPGANRSTAASVSGDTDTTSSSLRLDGMWCASCAILIDHVLTQTDGIVDVEIDYTSSQADIAYDPNSISLERISSTIKDLGYNVVPEQTQAGTADTRLRQRFVIAAVLSFLAMMVSIPVWFGYLPEFNPSVHRLLTSVLLILSAPVLFWAGWPFLRGALISVKNRVPTMDLLISIGSLAAFTYSCFSAFHGGTYLYFDTASLLITFLLLSKSLEVGAKDRATWIIRSLNKLSAKQATVVTNRGEETLPIESLQVGQQISVKPGETCPIDGVIQSGSSTFDEAFLTGEVSSAEKQKGDFVYAGTISLTGRVFVQVERIGENTVLGSTRQAVKDAEQLQSKRQRVVQRVLNIFVPTVLMVAIATFVLWSMVLKVSVSMALLHTIAVLVIACPCSLSIAVPLVSVGTVQRLTELGALLRSDDVIDRAKHIDTLVFDKTGTLTEGKFQLTKMVPEDHELLRLAASMETASEHPIARALVESANEYSLHLFQPDHFETVPGWGIRGKIGHRTIEIGSALPHNAAEIHTEDIAAWQAQGMTTSVLIVDGDVKAVMGFGDTVKASSRDTTQLLKNMGIDVVMLSGDNPGACAAAADQTGITTWYGNQTPAEKMQFVAGMQQQGKTVGFIGDGINDAPALVQSNFGVSFNTGTDVAMHSGHVVLTGKELTAVPHIIQTVQKAAILLRTNLVWALLYNIVALSFAVAGIATPAIAALSMLLSSTFVLGNSLRILGWSPLYYGTRILGIGAGLGVILGIAWLGL